VTDLTVRLVRPPVSLRVPVRASLVLVGMAVVVAFIAVLGLMVGRSGVLSPLQVLEGLTGTGTDAASFGVQQIRLPRIIAGALVGFALGLSGAVFQAIARNGLVSPDIIGVNSGASFAALVIIVLGTQTSGAGDALEVSYAWIAPAALVGAFLAAFTVYILGYRRGLSPYRLVLIGIGITSVLQSGIAYALTLTRFPFATELAFRWTIGDLYGTDWTEVTPALVVFAALVVLALLRARPLSALTLGDETAVGLGARVERDRLGLIVIGVCFAAVAVALAGPVGFVAFIAPHLARAMTGATGPLLVIASGLAGATLTLIADFIAVHALPDVELPLGAVTALIGAPYFLVLLYRTNRLGEGG
jgi:iron complex transport system permease protein